MKEFWKRFWKEEDGMETIEVVVIIAVLIAIALIFRKAIVGFVQKLVGQLFSDGNVGTIANINEEG